MFNVLRIATKDLRILSRDRWALFWVIGFPLLMAVLFGAMFGGSGKRDAQMKLGVADEDASEASRAFIKTLGDSDALLVTPTTREEGLDRVRRCKLTACLILKKGFGSVFPMFAQDPKYEVGIDPSRTAEAGYLQGLLLQAMFTSMIERFVDPQKVELYIDQQISQVTQEPALPEDQKNAIVTFLKDVKKFANAFGLKSFSQGFDSSLARMPTVSVTRDAKTPTSGYQVSFPSAVLWALVGCVITFSVSIVRERTSGTLLRLRVAPVGRAHILAGKALACASACLSVTTALVLIGIAAFGLRVTQPAILALAIVSSAACFTGIMMLLSVLGRTEQAVGGSSSGVMILMTMFGGGMIPLLVMPAWMQTASHFSPAKWVVLSVEGAIWRQFTLHEMFLPCTILWGVGLLAFIAGTWRLAQSEG